MTSKRRFKQGDLVKLVRVDPSYSNYVPALDGLVGKYFQIQGFNPFHKDEVSIGSWYVAVDWLEPVGVWQLVADHADLCGQMAAMMELLRDCDTELDDLMCRVRRLAEDAPDDDTTDADELRRRIAALTPQPAPELPEDEGRALFSQIKDALSKTPAEPRETEG